MGNNEFWSQMEVYECADEHFFMLKRQNAPEARKFFHLLKIFHKNSVLSSVKWQNFWRNDEILQKVPEMPEIDWYLNIEALMPDWSFEGKKMPDWHRRMPDGNSAVCRERRYVANFWIILKFIINDWFYLFVPWFVDKRVRSASLLWLALASSQRVCCLGSGNSVCDANSNRLDD